MRGFIGIHVDDGLFAGDSVFHEKINELERKFPFGSRKRKNFVFTGLQDYKSINKMISQSPLIKLKLSMSKISIRFPSTKTAGNIPKSLSTIKNDNTFEV